LANGSADGAKKFRARVISSALRADAPTFYSKFKPAAGWNFRPIRLFKLLKGGRILLNSMNNQGVITKPFQDHFSQVAKGYADFRPQYPAALLDYLATLVPQDSVVWDCAAGNGQASIDLGKRFEKVIATDGSAEQIAAALPRKNVEYRVATAERSGLPSESIGLITVAQALHWFDFDRFYTEARRVLRPDGVIAVWAYGINQVEDEIVNKRIQNFYSEVVGPYWPPERRLVEERYQSIPFPFDEFAAPSFRMEIQWNLNQLLGYFSTWSATNRFIKERGFSPLPQLAVDLTQAWGEPQLPRLVTWPVSIRLGRRHP
jgi:ubiquinone/menaquinone biosynthesis C-methylase UbiE